MNKLEILEDIRRKILSEHYPQGHPLVERELCTIYGVSRTPVREILRNLVSEGVVVQRPNRGGFTVRQLDWEHIFEIFQARMGIEGTAARIACTRASAHHVTRLRELRNELAAVDTDHLCIDGPRIGRLMHRVLIDAAANSIMTEFYDKLSNLTTLCTNIARQSIPIEINSQRHHLAIMDAVIRGDEDTSETWMREHLRETCRSMIEMLYPALYSKLLEKRASMAM